MYSFFYTSTTPIRYDPEALEYSEMEVFIDFVESLADAHKIYELYVLEGSLDLLNEKCERILGRPSGDLTVRAAWVASTINILWDEVTA